MQILKIGVYEMNTYPWVEKPPTRASIEAKFIFLSVLNIFLLNEQNTSNYYYYYYF